MEIRLANEKDKKNLQKFFKHYGNSNLIINRVNCYIDHNSTILAEENGKIVGVIQWYLKEDPKAGVIEFEELFVLKEKRGKGIGNKLVDFAIKHAKSTLIKNKIKPRKIYLFVNKNNVIARKLYEKFGFKFIAELNDLFTDSENEFFYCLNL